MPEPQLVEREIERSLRRLRPRLEARFAGFASSAPGEWAAFFSEQAQIIPSNLLRVYGQSYSFTDLVTGQTIPATDLELEPLGFMCLRC